MRPAAVKLILAGLAVSWGAVGAIEHQTIRSEPARYLITEGTWEYSDRDACTATIRTRHGDLIAVVSPEFSDTCARFVDALEGPGALVWDREVGE